MLSRQRRQIDRDAADGLSIGCGGDGRQIAIRHGIVRGVGQCIRNLIAAHGVAAIGQAIARTTDRETLLVQQVANTPDQFGARIKAEIEKWAKVVRDAKLRIE